MRLCRGCRGPDSGPVLSGRHLPFVALSPTLSVFYSCMSPCPVLPGPRLALCVFVASLHFFSLLFFHCLRSSVLLFFPSHTVFFLNQKRTQAGGKRIKSAFLALPMLCVKDKGLWDEERAAAFMKVHSGSSPLSCPEFYICFTSVYVDVFIC